MNIIDENFKSEDHKPKKTARIILAVIIILFILVIVIITLLLTMQEKKLIVAIDGKLNEKVVSMLKFESDGTIYIPVRKISQYLGYETFNGEYLTKSEETSKCYVQTIDEVINLKLNSNKVDRIGLTESNQDYEYYYMKKPVKAIDGELYISSDGMINIFNTSFEYNSETKKITMFTMPYLIKVYASKVLDYGYESVDSGFSNQKSIFENMLVVTKGEKKNYGVIDIKTGDIIIETKYTSIKYIPSIKDFIVKANDKYGVVGPNKQTKIKVVYESIDLIDRDAALYAVKKDNKYGILDLKGDTKVNVEYDEIGIEKTKFEDNGIKNKYLLVDNLIPLRRDKVWGMVDKKGNIVVEFIYNSFGYITSNTKNAKNLLVIPEYNVIVSCKEKKYALINSSGKPLFAPVVDDIYMTYEDGRYKYYMLYNDQKMDVEEFLNRLGIVVNSEDDSRNNQNTTNTVNKNEIEPIDSANITTTMQ